MLPLRPRLLLLLLLAAPRRPEGAMAYEDLTGKQRLFVDAYIGRANANATEAARQAGYSSRSEGALRVTAHDTLTNPNVSAAIEERMREMSIPPAEILSRLTEQARALHAGFLKVDDDGAAFVDLRSLEDAGLMRLVKKVSFDAKGNQTIEFHDAQAALLALSKRYDLLPDHTKVSGSLTLDAVLNALPEEFRESVRRELAAMVRAGTSNGRR